MTHSLHQVSKATLIAFILVALSSAYWSVVASDSMLARDDNPRRVEAEEAIIRGTLYDRAGQVLAQMVPFGTAPSGQQLYQRSYPHPEAASAIGYYSLVHGVGGVEAAFDKQLRGEDLTSSEQAIVNVALHQPQVGSDLRLTLDIKLQNTIADLMKNRQGAVVAIDVPTGAVLAMVSAPTFDPNRLNATYDSLLADPAAPLLNRVTQGIYQPGGALQTVILASMLAEKVPITEASPGAAQPVQVNGLTLGCARAGNARTIAAAYTLACPAPFAQALTGKPGAENVHKMFDAFGLLHAPTLLYLETVSGSTGTSLLELTDPVRLRAQGVGQNDLTVTPLQMLLVASIIANHGNAITPYLVDAVRQPGSATWTPLPSVQNQTAVVTQEVADSIRTAMQDAITNGAASAAAQSGLQIYGHASIAYTGPKQNADSWFIGFIDRPDGTSVAVAVVIEEMSDVSVAARIGGNTLAAAVR